MLLLINIQKDNVGYHCCGDYGYTAVHGEDNCIKDGADDDMLLICDDVIYCVSYVKCMVYVKEPCSTGRMFLTLLMQLHNNKEHIHKHTHTN